MNHTVPLDHLSIGDEFTLLVGDGTILIAAEAHSATEVSVLNPLNGDRYRLDTSTKVVKVSSRVKSYKTAPLQCASIKTVFPSQVSVTSHEIAKLITELDSVGQAEVLNELARLCKDYMSTQLQSISDNQLLTGDAKYFMKKVGDYSGI